MMSRHKNMREAVALIESLGLSIVAIEQGKHLKLTVERCGQRRRVIHTLSRSCPRAMKNFRADLRRLAAELRAFEGRAAA